MKIAEGCVEEYKKFSMLDFSTIEDEIRNSIEVPEYPYAEKKDIALSVNESVSDMGMDDISVMNESEDYETSLGAEVCEQISAEDTMDATVGDASEANIVEEYVGDRSDDKGSYEAYKKMTPMEKAQMHGFRKLKSYDTVRSVVQMKFLDMGHIADVDELLEETDLIYKGMCELVVKNKTEEVLDEIKAQGYKYSTLSAITVAVPDAIMPDEKPEILAAADKKIEKVMKNFNRGLISDEERYRKTVEIWQAATEEVSEALSDNLKKNHQRNPIYMMSDSGARGSMDQIKQLAGMRGLLANTAGKTLEMPIRANYREGLNILEYFISSRGARKGLADTALRTADSGYLTRRLVDVSQEVIIREEDCHATEGIWVREISEGNSVVESFKERLNGRYSCMMCTIRHG